MKGILLMSHGELAQGLSNSATLFFGERIEQFDYLCLFAEDDVNDFGLKIEEKIKSIDVGDGVIILADIMGGSPANQAMKRLNQKIELLSGMNLSMLLQCLTDRMTDNVDLNQILDAGIQGISNMKEFLYKVDEDWLDD